jgi:hypothetical protein
VSLLSRLLLAALCAAAAVLAAPATAGAHGLIGRSDLPIPDWLFIWGAAVVLIVSFAGLAALWPTPRLQEQRVRPAPRGLDVVLSSRVTEVVCGAVGVALLGLVVWAGLRGTQDVSDNIAPTFVYVAFWLGLVPVSAIFGDVFRAFNPWRAVGRATGALTGRVLGAAPEPLDYPRRLGYWPAVAGLLAFAWIELISISGDEPDSVAVATLVYSAFTWLGMAVFGVEAWASRGEAFGVYFGLIARLSPVGRFEGRLVWRRPLAGLTDWPTHPGAVALLAVMIGTVSFDGLSAGKPFNDVLNSTTGWLRDDLGMASPDALRLVYVAGMLVSVLVIAGLYWLGVAGARSTERRRSTSELARSFAHTLVPIALAYVAAHYVSLLLIQGQAMAALASDPLGRGWDLLGTASASVDYGVIGAEVYWYLQVAFVVLGHMVALALAHDRALVSFGSGRAAVRSQVWLLLSMVAFTNLALWLLAQAREG